MRTLLVTDQFNLFSLTEPASLEIWPVNLEEAREHIARVDQKVISAISTEEAAEVYNSARILGIPLRVKPIEKVRGQVDAIIAIKNDWQAAETFAARYLYIEFIKAF